MVQKHPWLESRQQGGGRRLLLPQTVASCHTHGVHEVSLINRRFVRSMVMAWHARVQDRMLTGVFATIALKDGDD